MKDQLIKLLKFFLKKLEKDTPKIPLVQEQERIFIRNGVRRKRSLCPVTEKVNHDEQTAKVKAKASKDLKLRAYKCQFCSNWHLTHKKNKLMFH